MPIKKANIEQQTTRIPNICLGILTMSLGSLTIITTSAVTHSYDHIKLYTL